MSRPPRWMLVTLAVGFLAIGAAGAWFYVAQRQYLRRMVSADLLTVARTKADRIVAWRTSALHEAAESQKSPIFVAAVERWLRGRRRGDAVDLLAQLRVSQTYMRFVEVLLVDGAGRILLATSGRGGGLDREDAATLRAAIEGRRPTMGDVHASPDVPIPHLTIIAPLFALRASGGQPIGAVVDVVDSRHALFPFAAVWVSPSRTSEVLLVQRSGDSLRTLTGSRLRPGEAPPPSDPLSRRGAVPVQLVATDADVAEGVDYRGVRVLAAIQSVPGTPWSLVVKVDAAEALLVWRSQAAHVAVVLLGLVLAAGAIAVAVVQRRAKAHYRRLYEAEAALGASETRFRRLFDVVTDVVLVHGLADDGTPLNFSAANEAACRQLGYTREELLQLSVRDIAAPDSTVDVRAIAQRKLRGERVLFERTLVAKDGRRIPVEIHAQSFDASGRTGVLSVARDITERQRSEAALRQSEARFKAQYRHHPTATFTWRRVGEDFALVDCNDAAEAITGQMYNSFVGRRASEIYAQRPEIIQDLDRSFARGVVLTRERQSEHFLPGRHVVITFAPVPPDLVMVHLEDITERKRAEEALRTSDARFRELFSCLSSGVAVLEVVENGEDFVIRDFNPAAEQLDDVSKTDILGKRVSEVFPTVMALGLSNVARRVWQTGSAEHVPENLYRDEGGHESWREARVFKLPTGEIVAIYSDITERKRSEAALRALARHLDSVREEEHIRIARQIHDELGQALTALRLDLTWLGRKLPKGNTALRRRIDAAVALTDETITVGQRIVGELRPPILDDLGLVPALEWYTEHFARRSGLRIVFDPWVEESVVPAHLAATAYRIVQEALTNVVRHARATHAWIRVGEQEGALTIEVRDDGQGLPEGAADSPLSLGFLGMRERVASQGGALGITSQPGGGTTVRATFPPERRKAPRSPG